MGKIVISFIVLGFTFSALGKTPETKVQTGKVSFYAGKWIGKKTASGEIYKKDDLTALNQLIHDKNLPVIAPKPAE